MSTGLVGLDHEPRYKVDELVEEMKGRARSTVADLGQKAEVMAREVVTALDQFKEEHYLVTLRDVRFESVAWARESGDLVVSLGLGRASGEGAPRHEVIDPYVDEVVGRSVPQEFRDECGGFLRGLLFQFMMLAKFGLNLRAVTFDRPRWTADGELSIRVRHNGEPLLPRDVGV